MMGKTVDSYRFISGITKQARNHPPQDPPIASYLARHAWFLSKLLSRRAPR